MIGPDQALELLTEVLALITANEAEATLLIEDQALISFANSAIHQNVTQRNARLVVRAVVDGGVGVATTNRLDGEGRRWVADRATTSARLQPPNPEFPGLPKGGAPRPATTYYEATAAVSADRRAEAVGVLVDTAARQGFTVAGSYGIDVDELAIANTSGAAAYAPLTLASLRAVVDANPPQGIGFLTGYADAISRDVTQIDVRAVDERTVAKCALNREPRSLPSGGYVTVLEDIAVAELLHFWPSTV